MKMIKTIIIGWALVTLIGVELKAEVAENLNGSWIDVHGLPMDDCVSLGGIYEVDMDSNSSKCHIQDYYLKYLEN